MPDGSIARILKELGRGELIARHRIADATDLTRTTVSKAVSELMDLGIVEELEPGPASARGGRRPIGLKLKSDAFNVVGLDLRREKITGCLVNFGGGVEAVAVRDIGRTTTSERFLDAVSGTAAELIEQSRSPVMAIGIGSIGPVDPTAGVIHVPDFPALRHVPIVDILAERFRIPAALRIGAVMAAYGEERIVADRSAAPRSVAFVVIDYGGIGLGLISGGSAWVTNHGGVGELGHMTIDLHGRPCTCGRRGCLVQYASGRALLESIGDADPTDDAAEASLARVAGKAEAGDEAAREAIVAAGEYLGCGIVDIDRLLRPERIVIGGSHDHLAAWYMRGVRKYVQKTRERRDDPKLLDRLTLAAHGSSAIAYGAATMQLKHFIRSPAQILDLLSRAKARPLSRKGEQTALMDQRGGRTARQ